MLKKLLVLSFVEGATVMAAELCGAKLLAPIYGSSLYVWASVMGITLAALALGYFYGGSLSSKTDQVSKYLFRVLASAAVFVVLMPVLSYYVVPRISYLPFLSAVVLSTFFLLFAPVFFLGTSSPLFVAMQLGNADGGRVSGTVYAVSTFGGIVATFLCGFYLIPQIGLKACLMSFGAILFIVNCMVFKGYKPLQLILIAASVYLNLQFGFKKPGQLFASDSILGHLEVEDFVDDQRDSIRVLKINSIIQTEMNLKTRHSVSDYVRLLDTLVSLRTASASALVLGLGGGLTANLLTEKNYQVDRVELDGRIVLAAHRYFYLDKGCTYLGDARYFMNHCKKKYDLILVDIFKAEEQPSHVLTRESLESMKNNLTGDGWLLINWHGYVRASRGLGTSVLYNTLVSTGFHVKLCSTSSNEDYRNIIVAASLRGLPALPYELNERVQATALLNTDDMPLLESTNAEANKSWRHNYLRFYQNR